MLEGEFSLDEDVSSCVSVQDRRKKKANGEEEGGGRNKKKDMEIYRKVCHKKM